MSKQTKKSVVVGEAILGANICRDIMAGIRDIVGDQASMLMVSVSGTAVTVQ